ncbi:hypothetical protein PL335_17080 (plasmid) [Sulfitobacter faviae]|uniref:hypothetical protein n=1 Tax=Sulfitobacter faviae TaxID=1775881 RepID=UPI00230725A3|nr:hypothetical protein [Sulfitobacter faviae]WCE68560.1 hypothetical protein PL335_17080 [Sulfitobacter faviae]
MDATGKLAHGRDALFNQIANVTPGLEKRLPLMFNAMVTEGGMGVEAFAKASATAPARAFGLDGERAIAGGFDADLAIWDPEGVLHLRGR